MDTLPKDAEPLEISGYFAHAQIVNHGWNQYYTEPDVKVTFNLIKEGSYRYTTVASVDVSVPNGRSGYRMDQIMASVTMGQLHRQLDAKGASMLAKVVDLAAAFAAGVDEANEPVIARMRERIEQEERQREERRARYEEERKKQIEQARIDRERRAERIAKAKEQLQWYVGQNFKLKRDGYRSTVFGEVIELTERYMRTISERGVPMRIELDKITQFSVKYEGEKRYTLVYTREDS